MNVITVVVSCRVDSCVYMYIPINQYDSYEHKIRASQTKHDLISQSGVGGAGSGLWCKVRVIDETK